MTPVLMATPVAEVAGFEPTCTGVKVPCLTAWRHPNVEPASAALRRRRSVLVYRWRGRRAAPTASLLEVLWDTSLFRRWLPWHRLKDSNLHERFWRPSCSRYIKPMYGAGTFLSAPAKWFSFQALLLRGSGHLPMTPRCPPRFEQSLKTSQPRIRGRKL